MENWPVCRKKWVRRGEVTPPRLSAKIADQGPIVSSRHLPASGGDTESSPLVRGLPQHQRAALDRERARDRFADRRLRPGRRGDGQPRCEPDRLDQSDPAFAGRVKPQPEPRRQRRQGHDLLLPVPAPDREPYRMLLAASLP
jgi:hypothetical protein